MIRLIAQKYQRIHAGILIIAFSSQLACPVYPLQPYGGISQRQNMVFHEGPLSAACTEKSIYPSDASVGHTGVSFAGSAGDQAPEHSTGNSGGPGPVSPEAATFQSIGSDNLVNLFTGDFSYSIPLLDVGGYPVNLFYTGGITMEQEASWVGLGWNINPGSVTRNVRGIPDDFNGHDTMIQKQNTKPNITWGAELGADAEALGIKKPGVQISLGFSYNNYLGPELNLGIGGSVSLASIQTVKSEKGVADTTKSSLGLNVRLSSRSGFTLSPSLSANMFFKEKSLRAGFGLSTGYNSRTGIQALNVFSEMGYYDYKTKMKDGKTKEYQTNLNYRLSSSSISFSKPSYTPVVRMPMVHSHYAGQIELGTGIFGLRGAATGAGYKSESYIPAEMQSQDKPLVGYLYLQNAIKNKDYIMDFNRLNDAEVTPNTPVISVPVYTYDIFTVQGEGTGGVIRAYRNDLGFVRDNETASKDKSASIGVDLAPVGHFGGNWNHISTPTKAGEWDDANNLLINTIAFQPPQPNSSFENVYFRNPGESAVTNEEMLAGTGGDDLVRFELSGPNSNPRLEAKLARFDKVNGQESGTISLTGKDQKRAKRTQVITMLTAEEASRAGLETGIRDYTGAFNPVNDIVYQTIPRVSGYRKAHHISEINVLEQSGRRYVYGIPVYNTLQKDFTFSVEGLPDTKNNLVAYAQDETTMESPHTGQRSQMDGYVQIQQTPPYATAFLLTGLLSPDYVDLTGDGITEDDIGTAVKFNYSMSPEPVRWRTPRHEAIERAAHFNEGYRTEKKDDKALFSYGEREAWYLQSIESRSMIAIFTLSSRRDAKSAGGEDNARSLSDDASKRLGRIDLYTKSEIKTRGITDAVPVKSVHFEYDYSLCTGVPGNDSAQSGKLTLKSVYFSYNGQDRQSKEKYVFGYNETVSQENPGHSYNSSDRWGTYKPPLYNPDSLTNIDYPYTDTSKARSDLYAGAWSLKKILLPSGGLLEIDYEAKDYAYVQNKRACNMYNIYGFGTTKNYTASNALYNRPDADDNLYVYIHLPRPLTGNDAPSLEREIRDKYLDGLEQLAFQLQVNMPRGPEPLTVYAEYDEYGVCPNSHDNQYIYIRLKAVDGKSPLARSSIGFLTGNLPGQAFPGFDARIDDLADFIHLAGTMLSRIKEAFQDVDRQMRSAGKARLTNLPKSFVRLANPDRKKYGGGVRVKRVALSDNWNRMTGKYDSRYGQEYDYTTTEKVNGKELTISSGVATYEPGIGGIENPFRNALLVKNKLPAASAQYGAIETPVQEGLFPAPSVGYSKVTVRSINRNGTRGDSTFRSAIGKQVSEFYTARDFPVRFYYTPLATKEYHKNPLFSFFYKEVADRKTVSQGFLVETNDMHGKIKTQAAYSESDENTPVTASYHSYKNTGLNGLNDRVDFVYGDSGLMVKKGNMGIDIELMTDVREFSVRSSGLNIQGQIDIFPVIFPFSIPTAYPLKTEVENLYRAVTCTKLISYHAIPDTVVTIDRGSSARSVASVYDAETGAPVVSLAYNEFDDPVYTTRYPAWWAYTGMGPASKNIDTRFENVNFYDGKAISAIDTTMLEGGDELLVVSQGNGSEGCIPHSPETGKLWVFDPDRPSSPLIQKPKNLYFLDRNGNPFTGNNVSLRIIRSGKRNLTGQDAGEYVTAANPVSSGFLTVNNAAGVLNATATLYNEKWQADPGVIFKRTYYFICNTELDSLNCNGILEKKINPYVKGLLGNFKISATYKYYGEREGGPVNGRANTRKDGYISAFTNLWQPSANRLVPDGNAQTENWIYTAAASRINKAGQTTEIKDGLGRYSNTQYGRSQHVLMSETFNSRLENSFYEGFEDANTYTSLYNEGKKPCSELALDLYNIPLTTIADNTGKTGLAHSGNHALAVPAGQSAGRQIGVRGISTNNFSFVSETDTLDILTNPGGNVSSSGSWPPLQTNTDFLSSQVQITTLVSSSSSYSYTMTTSQYRHFYDSGTYHFDIAAYTTALSTFYMYWAIYDLDDKIVAFGYTTEEGSQISWDAALCAGTYRMDFACTHQLINSGSAMTSYFFDFAGPGLNSFSVPYKNTEKDNSCVRTRPLKGKDEQLNAGFHLVPGQAMLLSGWVKEQCELPCFKESYDSAYIQLAFNTGATITCKADGAIIDGWQQIGKSFTVPQNATSATLSFVNASGKEAWFDDIRIHPFDANMKSYAYDQATLRPAATLDENNYATFYEYDEEGQLVRVKKETERGIQTLQESRSAKQKTINNW